MEKTQKALAHWLQQRHTYWLKLNKLMQQHDRSGDDPKVVHELLQGFRALARDVSMVRKTLGHGQIAQQLEAMFAQAHEILYRKAKNYKYEFRALYTQEIPTLVNGILRTPILATVALFVSTAALGWLLVASFPDLVGLFASPDMINTVQSGELWTDGLLNIMPSSLLALGLMTNNIIVALTAFVLGAFYGLGTLYIIGLNGFMLGGIFAFTAKYDMAGRLFEFVIAHGVVELSVICLAGAAGVQLGEALIRPGNMTRAMAFQQAVSNAGKLLMVVVPFLVLAGIIEGFISPDPRYPMAFRVIIGLSSGLLLWLVLTGRLWHHRRHTTQS